MTPQEDSLRTIQSLIREVADFPRAGIRFKDITPVLSDGNCFRATIKLLCEKVPPRTSKIAAIESRGFILGSAIAHNLNIGLTLIRKPGKLPRETLTQTYDLEYGQDALQVHKDAFSAQDRICIVDDVLATGGTAAAAEALCRQSGAEVLGFAFLMELQGLNGRSRLTAPHKSLIRY